MTVGGGEAARTNLGDVSTNNPFFSITSPSMGGAKVLSMTNLANVSAKNPDISSMGPSMVNAQVLSMGFISYRSSYGSAKRITAIFNSYTPWRDRLWSPYLSLFLSYIWFREKFFNL